MKPIKRRPSLLASKLLIACLLIGCNSKDAGTEQAGQIESQKTTEQISINTKENILNKIVEKDNLDNQGHAIATEPYRLEGIEVSLLDVQRASGDTLNVYWRMENKMTSIQKQIFRFLIAGIRLLVRKLVSFAPLFMSRYLGARGWTSLILRSSKVKFTANLYGSKYKINVQVIIQ